MSKQKKKHLLSDTNQNMLTSTETLRQVILRLYQDDSARLSMFTRRKIKRGSACTSREFRVKRRASMAIIHKSLSRLYPLYLDGTLALADAEYESRAGQAGIDIIMNVVYGEYCSVTNIPPPIRRTKTPLLSSDVDELTVGAWEVA